MLVIPAVLEVEVGVAGGGVGVGVGVEVVPLVVPPPQATNRTARTRPDRAGIILRDTYGNRLYMVIAILPNLSLKYRSF
jgi:hypothetical protein